MRLPATASAVWVSRSPSGIVFHQAVYAACRASNSATVSRQRCGFAPVAWPSVADNGGGFVSPMAGAMAGLPLGIAERVFSLGLAAVGGLLAWCDLRYVTQLQWRAGF